MKQLRQTNVCMVEPAAFAYNAETAVTNRFQQQAAAAGLEVAELARSEANALAATLRASGIGVAMATDSDDAPCPDAVFPNNWVSFHDDGSVVLYPMLSPSRRRERREAVIDCVKARLGFIERRRIDLAGEEKHGRFLEGTGSLVLDHGNRIAYACRSPRTDEALVREWTRLMDFEPVLFDAASPDGTPVYHTNVVLWIGQQLAGAGIDWIAPDQRAHIWARLEAGGKRVLRLDGSQLLAFAGNMLELSSGHGPQLVMSATAAASLDPAQNLQIAEAGVQPVVAAVPTIERHGGGSVRCMLAEVPATGSPA